MATITHDKDFVKFRLAWGGDVELQIVNLNGSTVWSEVNPKHCYILTPYGTQYMIDATTKEVADYLEKLNISIRST